MLLIASLLLALIPLLGIVLIALSGSLTSVDGLFMSLILLAIAATLGSRAVIEFRRWRSFAAFRANRATQAAFIFAAGLTQRGRVQSVDFFESHVGQPNKSIVMLSRDDKSQMLVFEGDMRNALPAGQKVEITMRKQSGYNVLVDVAYP